MKRLLMVWGLLAVLTACSSSESAPRTAAGAAPAATRVAPVAASTRPKLNSL